MKSIIQILSVLLCTGIFMSQAMACDAVGGCAYPWVQKENGNEYSDTINPFLGRNESTSPAYKIHLGDDINDQLHTDLGDITSSLALGKVRFTGYLSGAGHVVVLEHTRGNGDGFCSQYDHLQYPITTYVDPASNYILYPRGSLNTDIAVGKSVGVGAPIGRVSGTGSTTSTYSPHIHLEIRLDYPACKNSPSYGYVQNTGTATSWGDISHEDMYLINQHLDPSMFVEQGLSSYVYKLTKGWNQIKVRFMGDISFGDMVVYKAIDNPDEGNVERVGFLDASDLGYLSRGIAMYQDGAWHTPIAGGSGETFWVYAFEEELMLILYGNVRDTEFNLGDVAQTTDSLKARLLPGTDGFHIYTLPVDDTLIIADGPQNADGYVWWKIFRPPYIEAWVAENWLKDALQQEPDYIPTQVIDSGDPTEPSDEVPPAGGSLEEVTTPGEFVLSSNGDFCLSGDTSVSLSWEASGSADTYSVYQDGSLIHSLVGDTTSATMGNLSVNQAYDFSVKASNSLGDIWSNTVTVNIGTPCEVPTAACADISHLTKGARSAVHNHSDGVYEIFVDKDVIFTESDPNCANDVAKALACVYWGKFNDSYPHNDIITNWFSLETDADCLTTEPVNDPVVEEDPVSTPSEEFVTSTIEPLWLDSRAQGWSEEVSSSFSIHTGEVSESYEGLVSLSLDFKLTGATYTLTKDTGSIDSTKTFTGAIYGVNNYGKVYVSLVQENGTETEKVILETFTLYPSNRYQWYTFSIPLTDMATTGETYTGIRFSSSTFGEVYLDVLQFE